ALPGVRESAVVGDSVRGEERVHAVLVLTGVDADEIVRTANARLADHQKIRGVSIWTAGPLPRTEGTGKLKRREVKEWLDRGRTTAMADLAAVRESPSVEAVLRRYVP